MFIERLENKDFEAFGEKFNCSVSKTERIENGIYLQLFTGYMGPQPEMYISDFDLRTSEYFQGFEKQLKTAYVHFMKEKFGKEYQEAYTKYYNKKVEEERII